MCVIFYNDKKLNDKKINNLQIAMLPLMLGLPLTSLFLEVANILNQYNIIISNRILIPILTYSILFLISIFIFIKIKNLDLKNFKTEKIYYFALILGILLITNQINLQTNVNLIYLFESANHGIAINNFFEYGKIPIIENFDAHMLYNSFLGYIIWNIK